MTRWSFILLFYIIFQSIFLLGNNVTEGVSTDDIVNSEREAMIGQRKNTLEDSTPTFTNGERDDGENKRGQESENESYNLIDYFKEGGDGNHRFRGQGQGHLNFEEKPSGGIHYRKNDVMRKLKKILASPNSFGFLPFLVNDALGREKMTPPFLMPSTSSHGARGRDIVPSSQENDPSVPLEIQKDPLSHSPNQLWRNIYDHQGTILGNLQLGSSHSQNFRNNHIQNVGNVDVDVDGWNWNPNNSLLQKERSTGQKRSTPNSGYICHFKLCQFGSSGKRLYKSTSQFTSLENNEK